MLLPDERRHRLPILDVASHGFGFDSEVCADVDARRLVNVERVARLEAEVEDLEGFSATLDEILDGSVTILGISPGDEAEYDNTEEGESFVIVPGWEDIIAKLRAEADAVLAGERKDLARTTVEWLKYMVRRFGVRVFIENGEGSDFAFRMMADRGRLFGDKGHIVTVNQERRL